jgi:hypothetical protein
MRSERNSTHTEAATRCSLSAHGAFLALAKTHKNAAPPRPREGGTRIAVSEFQVPADFRRDFTTYATSHGLDLNELLKRAFESGTVHSP